MIAAFDMGIKNFAFAVKDTNKDKFVLLKHTSLNKNLLSKTDLNKFKKKNLIEMMKTLQITTKAETKNKMIKKEMVELILPKYKKMEKNKPKDLGLALFELMDDYNYIWNNCETFLIERQMTVNRQALKLSHYLEAYFKIHYPSKKILSYSAVLKTKKLGAVNLKTKKDRKEWTVRYVLQLLDEDNLVYFQSLTKQDDIADVVCMIESFCQNKFKNTKQSV